MSRCVVLLAALTACGRISFERVPPDAGETPSCDNVLQDGDETGIDCGLACGRACLGDLCSTDAECVTNNCGGVCELAPLAEGWLPGPSLATPRTQVQAGMDGEGTIHVVGGSSVTMPSDALATTETLKRPWTAWDAGPNMNAARTGHGVGSYADVVYAFGGRDNAGADVLPLEALVAGAWVERAPWIGSAGISVIGVGGRLYVLDFSMYIYDVANDSWSTGPSTPIRRDVVGGTLGPDARIYEVAGQDEFGDVRQVAVDAFDVQAQQWVPVAPLPVAKGRLSAVLAPDSRIYAAGGDDGTGATATVFAYNHVGDRWTPVQPMTQPRSRFALTQGGDGRIFAIGGQSNATTVLDSVEVYGPVTTLSRSVANVGDTFTIDASNFAPNARIVVRIDGVFLTSALADTRGEAQIDAVVPPIATGSHYVMVMDQRSQYRVIQHLTVQ